ncbi:MAG: radical SAM protein [Elusimicrobiota bacterium]
MTDISIINITMAKYFGGRVVYERTSAGAVSLIGALEHAGYNVNFHEHFIDHRNTLAEEAEKLIPFIDISSGIIGMGCHSVHLPFVVMASKELKARFPDKKIILGGIGPSSVADKLLDKFDFIDAIVVGEAEETIIEVMRSIGSTLAGIKGVVYRDVSGVHINANRPPIEDLDTIPLPAYHIVNFEEYEIPTIITSRGCPHRCPFCSLSLFWGKRTRYRSTESSIRELKLLKEKYGVKYVFFADPTFNADKQRVIDLCAAMRTENLDLKWECLVRSDLMDDDIMREMSLSGCDAVFFGLETGSEHVYKKIKRGATTVADSIEVIRRSSEFFKTTEVGLMWGFPFETLDDFKKTLAVRNKLETELCTQVQLRWLEPYPCTDLFKEYSNELFLPKDVSLVYKKDDVTQEVAKGKEFYAGDKNISNISIVSDVTNVRLVIAASHTASFCRDIIEENPSIFPDYYRYRTPDLDKKLELARKYSIY